MDIHSSKYHQNMYKELTFKKMSGYRLPNGDITIQAQDLDKPEYKLDSFFYKDGSMTGCFINRMKQFYVNISMEYLSIETALYIRIIAVSRESKETLLYSTELIIANKKSMDMADFNVAVMYGKKLYEKLDREL